MRTRIRKIVLGMAWVAAVVTAMGCNSINREGSPVKLIVTNTQNVSIVDLNGGTGCDQDIGTIEMRSLLLQDQASTVMPTDNRFNDIIIDHYEVTYVRTDGGSALPAPFTRTISTTIFAGGTGDFFSKFIVFQPDAIRQAPFASLLPVNGGRDPQTGKAFISMDVIVTLFGSTLAGERVSGSTKFPLTFCFDCNGCA